MPCNGLIVNSSVGAPCNSPVRIRTNFVRMRYNNTSSHPGYMGTAAMMEFFAKQRSLHSGFAETRIVLLQQDSDGKHIASSPGLCVCIVTMLLLRQYRKYITTRLNTIKKPATSMPVNFFLWRIGQAVACVRVYPEALLSVHHLHKPLMLQACLFCNAHCI